MSIATKELKVPSTTLMQGLPQSVHNVTIYPYIPSAPTIVVQPVGENGVGTYSVGTLITQVFYNLDLNKLDNPELKKGAMYYAICTSQDGTQFQTPGMYCLEVGTTAKFGLTKNFLKPHTEEAYIKQDDGPYIVIADLEDINVVLPFQPPAIGQAQLIKGVKGQLIATKFGTPHLMGIRVDATSPLIHTGEEGFQISGKQSDNGKDIIFSNMKCVSSENPSIFLQDFPGNIHTEVSANQAQLSFIGLTNIAVKLVTQKYPKAKLLEADGVSLNGPTTKPQDINQWRFVFQLPNNATAIITTKNWGSFNPIQYIDQPWLEDVTIPWPISMDITEASELMQKAGYTTPYKFVTLRWPLYPGLKQPFYIFSLTNGENVFVGVYDHKVTV